MVAVRTGVDPLGEEVSERALAATLGRQPTPEEIQLARSSPHVLGRTVSIRPFDTEEEELNPASAGPEVQSGEPSGRIRVGDDEPTADQLVARAALEAQGGRRPVGAPGDALSRLSSQWGGRARAASRAAGEAEEAAGQLTEQALETGTMSIQEGLEKNAELAAQAKIKMDQGAELLGSEAAHLEEFKQRREELHTKWKRDLKFADVAMDYFRAPISELKELRATDEALQEAQIRGDDIDEIARLQTKSSQMHAKMEEYRGYDTSGPYKTTGQKILAKIAIALGSMGSGLAGTPDVIWQQYQQSFKDDIARQREMYQQRVERRGRVDTEYSRMLEIMGSDHQVEMAMLDRMYKQTMLQVDSLMKQTDNAERKAALGMQLAGLQQGAASNQMDILKAKSNEAYQSLAQQTGLSIAQIQAAAKAAKAKPKVGEAAIQRVADISSMNVLLDDLEAQFETGTGPMSWAAQYLPGTDSKAYNDFRRTLVTAYTKAMTGAQFSLKELERYEKQFPAAATWDATAKGRFRALRAQLESRLNEIMRAQRAGGRDTAALEQEFGIKEKPSEEAILRALGE